MKNKTKEEKIDLLHRLYHLDKAVLIKHNENQIDALIQSYQDENGQFKKTIKK